MLQQHRVKLETKPKKFEDRVLVRDWTGGRKGESRAPGLVRARNLGGKGDRWRSAEKTHPYMTTGKTIALTR